MQKRVLIVDHEPLTSVTLAANLSAWDYQVVRVANGMEALEMFRKAHPPRIVILDASVLGDACLETCSGLRDLAGDNCFIIILSSDEVKATQLDALEAGADAVIASPLDFRELRARLAAGMRGRRLAVSDPPLLDLPRPVAPRPTRDPADRNLAGRIVARKYQVNTLIGKGGMGTVWKGTHLALGTSVAIKFIKTEYARHSLARARFELEARSAARLQTKYAVKIFDYGVATGGMPYIVMEYLEGVSLFQHVQDRGPMSFTETLALITQVSHALDQLHASGTIHRDVKPDNILLVADPDASEAKRPYIAKIIDFGVAKVVHAEEEGAGDQPNVLCTQNGIVIGTPNYMPPEQLQGGGKPGIASDLWALAACAFTAITGEIPFEGSTLLEVLGKVCRDPLPLPSRVCPNVPPEFDLWFARACHRDPAMRFRSARELARALVEAHADYTDASLDMTPSLNSFVAIPPPPSDDSAKMLVTVRPMRGRTFELDAPTVAYR